MSQPASPFVSICVLLNARDKHFFGREKIVTDAWRHTKLTLIQEVWYQGVGVSGLELRLETPINFASEYSAPMGLPKSDVEGWESFG